MRWLALVLTVGCGTKGSPDGAVPESMAEPEVVTNPAAALPQWTTPTVTWAHGQDVSVSALLTPAPSLPWEDGDLEGAIAHPPFGDSQQLAGLVADDKLVYNVIEVNAAGVHLGGGTDVVAVDAGPPQSTMLPVLSEELLERYVRGSMVRDARGERGNLPVFARVAPDAPWNTVLHAFHTSSQRMFTPFCLVGDVLPDGATVSTLCVLNGPSPALRSGPITGVHVTADGFVALGDGSGPSVQMACADEGCSVPTADAVSAVVTPGELVGVLVGRPGATAADVVPLLDAISAVGGQPALVWQRAPMTGEIPTGVILGSPSGGGSGSLERDTTEGLGGLGTRPPSSD